MVFVGDISIVNGIVNQLITGGHHLVHLRSFEPFLAHRGWMVGIWGTPLMAPNKEVRLDPHSPERLGWIRMVFKLLLHENL